MSKLIAVVDDEVDILDLISLHLSRSGFDVRGFSTGEDFLKFLSSSVPDLVILDLMLPDWDGLEICRYLRSKNKFRSVPIIMLTARDTEMDRVLGLELGADDYVTKPFSPRELVARVKAVLRRGMLEEGDGERIRVGESLVIDLNRYEVFVDGERVDLTPTEFNILKILASKKGWVFTRDQILDGLWGKEKIVLDRTVDVHIRHLREKLGKAKHLIKNVRGVGYKVEE